jgi:hypothetical protein
MIVAIVVVLIITVSLSAFFECLSAVAAIYVKESKDRLEGIKIVRQEAVTVGVARWTADEKGKPKFEWIVPVEKKP